VRHVIRTLVLAGALVLAAAAAAGAQAPKSGEKLAYEVFTDYTKDGQIDPCRFTTEQLQEALDNVPADVRQYASDFPRAIREAIAARARGACDEPATEGGGSSGAPTVPPPAASTGGGSVATPVPSPTPIPSGVPTEKVVPEPPAPTAVAVTPQPADSRLERAAAATAGNDAPAPLIGLGVLAALLLLTAAMLATVKRLGRSEGPLAPAYHSWREAQWRAGGVWDDFRDWLRVGR
jgi:hypothetical protein